MAMTARERVIAALTFNNPDRPPRHLWKDPYIDLFLADELAAMRERFPMDITRDVPVVWGKSEREAGTQSLIGKWTDEWGCVWSVGEPGVIGEVKDPPLADWSALDSYIAPNEVLDNADFSAVNPFCAETDKFTLARSEALPFERMQFVRGTEALFMDLAYGTDEMLKLRDMIHDYNKRSIALWCETDVDGIFFLDDWGAQKNLLISPAQWRELFKPLYAEYCQMIHDAGKFVFMHYDGDITAIYPDLIDVGIDALNSQLFCMDIEGLGRDYKGKITFWGEIDRQQILSFGSTDDVRAAVQRVHSALDDGTGGVIAQCSWGKDVSAENITTVFEEWAKPL